MSSVAYENLSDINYQYVESAVFPRNLEFNYRDTCYFVHDMTPTNTNKYIMKIPKVVVSSLKRFVDVPSNALVTLDESVHVITPSSYTICKQDGRMVIEKDSFNYFISAASFVA